MLAVAARPRTSLNGEGCVTRMPGGSEDPPLRVNDGVLDRGRRWNPVEDALTALALDDGVVLPDLLEHEWSQSHVARCTQAVARGRRDSDALPDARDLLKG